MPRYSMQNAKQYCFQYHALGTMLQSNEAMVVQLLHQKCAFVRWPGGCQSARESPLPPPPQAPRDAEETFREPAEQGRNQARQQEPQRGGDNDRGFQPVG